MGGQTTPKTKIGPLEVAHVLVKGSRNENYVFPGGVSGLRAPGSGKRPILGGGVCVYQNDVWVETWFDYDGLS